MMKPVGQTRSGLGTVALLMASTGLAFVVVRPAVAATAPASAHPANRHARTAPHPVSAAQTAP
ncbi:hypothetical protein, partial [Ameyamaea chiangmaiensis]